MQEHHSAQNRKQHQRPIFHSHLDMPQLFKGGGGRLKRYFWYKNSILRIHDEK